MIRTRCLQAAIAFLLLHAGFVTAEIKNFTFRGTITRVDDEVFLLDSSVTNGAAFEGFYVFDAAAVDSNSDATVGDYHFNQSAHGMVVKVGNYVFRTNPRHVDFLIELVNRPEGDSYLLRSYINVCSQPLYVQHISWHLDGSGDSLTNDALPDVPPDLAKFQTGLGMEVFGGDGFGGMPYLIRGQVESIEEAPVVIPERPATTLGNAVEVSWPSRLGYFYQIQQSQDLRDWTNVGEPVLGDGTTLSRFFSRNPGRHLFYRVEIANFAN